MTVPVCSVHNVPMKQFDFGWKCTQRVGEGWCNQRIKNAPSTPQTPQAGTSQPGGEILQAAALQFAASLFRGAGPEMGDDAISLALKAYSAFKAVQ